MDIISAYREVGSYRDAAATSGTTAKTEKRMIARHESGSAPPGRRAREHNYHAVTELVAERVEKTKGRISAKRLLPAARAAGYAGPRVIFGGWSRNAKRCGATTITVADDRRCGPRSIWSSIGVCRADCTCSARSWRAAGSGSCAPPMMGGADTTLALLAECSSRPSARSPAWCSPTGWDARKGGVVANCHRSQFLYQQQAHE